MRKKYNVAYKVSHKTYFNERLNKVDFYGEDTHPLYIQVTFQRKSIFFKSSLFELLSEKKHDDVFKASAKPSVLSRVVQKEEELLAWTAASLSGYISLEDFRKEYEFQSKDLCSVTEDDFGLYLRHFFSGKKMDALSSLIRHKGVDYNLWDVLGDMKKAFQPVLYEKLINGAIPYGHMAAPFLLLHDFVRKMYTEPYFFTIMDWEKALPEKDLFKFLKTNYPDKDSQKLIRLIIKRIEMLEKEDS